MPTPIHTIVNDLTAHLRGLGPSQPVPSVRAGTQADFTDGVVPNVVVQPLTIEQIAAVVRFASARGLRLTPRGGGTRMHWGGVLHQIDILLDLSQYKRIIDYQPADMTITVEAGCPLAELQAVLAGRSQFLPIDPPVELQATVGGIAATQAAGPLQFGYGTLRDYIIGLRAVRPNGDIIKAGGRVVKNAAGYELTKLYTGSFGTLGILAELTFMVRPLPEAWTMLFVPLARVSMIEPVLASVFESPLQPILLEVLNQAALARLGPAILPQGPEVSLPSYGVIVGFAGLQAAVEWQTEQAKQLIASLPAPVGCNLRAYGASWDDLYPALLGARRFPPNTLICRASLLSSETAAFLDRAEAICRRYGIEPPLFAHAGSGIVHIGIESPPDNVEQLVDELIEAASTLPVSPAVPAMSPSQGATAAFAAGTDVGLAGVQGLGDLAELRRLRSGNLVIESGPASLRERLPVWGRIYPNQLMMQELKRRFDPAGTFNAGRMAGG